MSPIFPKNKDRLYLLLERKHDSNPGYLWSLLLAPSKERQDEARLRGHKNHVKEDSPENWTFYKEQIALSLSSSNRMVCRLLLAKIGAGDEGARRKLDDVLYNVLASKDDPAYRSRVWAMDAVEALFAAGVARHNLTRGELEEKANLFANETMLRFARRELVVERPSEVPTEDVRW
jgi:hypothetical protein